MGVFDQHLKDVYSHRLVTLQLTNRIYGGTPQRPDVIEAWLRTKTGVTQQAELAAMTKRTILEMDPELAEAAKDLTPYEVMKLASEKLATSQTAVGFKRDKQGGLFIESRQIKAGIKEATNIQLAGVMLGKNGRYQGKGAKNWVAERVFVGPERIYLGKQEIDGLELFVGHVSGPQGPRSTLTYYQYVTRPTISFRVAILQSGVIAEYWPQIWLTLQDGGIGALRSQDAGRFEVVKWDEVEPVPLASLEPEWVANNGDPLTQEGDDVDDDDANDEPAETT
jgi:hypothetical protein